MKIFPIVFLGWNDFVLFEGIVLFF